MKATPSACWLALIERTGQHEKAREAYERGIETAQRHGHPGMAEEYRMTLASNYEY